jgi:hypothetical protein
LAVADVPDDQQPLIHDEQGWFVQSIHTFQVLRQMTTGSQRISVA